MIDEGPSWARMAVSCAAAAAFGLVLPAAQHGHASGSAETLLFVVWLAGPLIAGGILASARFLPYLVPAAAWYGVLPIAMLAGWMAPASCPDCDFAPGVAVVYLLGAFPFAVTAAGIGAFVAGKLASLLGAR